MLLNRLLVFVKIFVDPPLMENAIQELVEVPNMEGLSEM